ncbi:MAG: hypothetical protein ACI9N9_001912, partial [Enterobacterales bacterium]
KSWWFRIVTPVVCSICLMALAKRYFPSGVLVIHLVF